MENYWRSLRKEYSFKIVVSINVICTLSNVALRILRIHSDTMYVRCTHSESESFINKVTYQWLVQIIARSPLVTVSLQVLSNREIRQDRLSERFIVVRREERRWSTDKICHVTWTRRRQILWWTVIGLCELKKYINDNILRGRGVFAHQNDRIVIAQPLLVFFPALTHSRLEAHRAADALGHELMRPGMAAVSCNAKISVFSIFSVARMR